MRAFPLMSAGLINIHWGVRDVRGFVMFKRVVLFLVIVIGWAFLTAAAQSAPRNGYTPGTIVVKTGERRLYYTTPEGRTLSFPVGVGKKGWSWHGHATIEAKYLAPAWS